MAARLFAVLHGLYKLIFRAHNLILCSVLQPHILAIHHLPWMINLQILLRCCIRRFLTHRYTPKI